ncbi:hypothetical protein GTA08_BOTSDO04380 [Neofusicoccum parvum]|uniref:Uncharacterized protein n=1 Tax=Neofusicoccum parvum TaxID=310453 RepID=A0ACB5S6C9_9PEZI|nr:hypothetical protein GTA08_BOTSDO04380 [Neofusicoccum parvum]
MQRSSADASQQAPRITAPSSLVASALEAGALTGGCGLLLGGAQGILFSGSPGLFAAFAGVQWLTAGSVYWGKFNLAQAWFDVKRGSHPDASKIDLFSHEERVKASSIAGGVSGGVVAAVTRSRAHVIPGAVMFSIFGFAGQHIYNFFDTRHAARPVKVLSEDEYEEMLKEKLLKVDVEIALVDESIEKLRQQNQISGNPEK